MDLSNNGDHHHRGHHGDQNPQETAAAEVGSLLKVTDLSEDTEPFGNLVVDLMQRSATADPHRSIRGVVVDGYGAHREPPWAGSRNIDLFFLALALHPLETIRFENIGMFPYDERSGPFPIRLLSGLLRSEVIRSKLSSLILRDIVLEGTAEEWDELLDGLGTLPALEVFHLETCDCAIDFPLEQFTSFDAVIRRLVVGISSDDDDNNGNNSHACGNGESDEFERRHRRRRHGLKRLVVVPAQDYGGRIDRATLKSLLLPNSLLQLTLSNVGRIGNDAMATIFDALSGKCGSGDGDGDDKFHRAGGATTRLEILDLKNCELGESAIRALSGLLLRQEESLTTIKIGLMPERDAGRSRHLDPYREEAWMLELFGALKRNRTVEKFVLSSGDDSPRRLSPSATEAYEDVMHINCTLLDMFITYPNLHFHPNVMGFYAKLNRLGRRRFLHHESHGVTRCEWVEMLSRVSNDESCLFYFLRLNPLLLPQHA